MSIEQLTIFFGSRKFPLGDLLGQKPPALSPFEHSVVELCRKWIRGDDQFEATTSGSTGTPKNIAFTRSQMKTSALLTSRALGLKEGMTAMLCLDPQFIAGKMMVIRCLVTGMNLLALNAVANPLDHLPKELSFIDFAAFVPLQVITALDSGHAPKFDKFGTIIVGGGKVDADLRARLQNLSTSFYSTFGMTETITHVALQKLNGKDQTDFMQALPGVTFTIDDRGCLVINAPFIGDPVVTNDIVELVDSSTFRWLGRWDYVINSGGVKVIPEVVEPEIGNALAKLQLQNRFFVWGFVHPLLGQEVVLVLEGMLSPGQEQTLTSALKSQLPKYSAPRKIIYAGKFVFTPTGKIMRSESAAKASPRPD